MRKHAAAGRLAARKHELEGRRGTDVAFVYTDCFLVDAEGEVLGIGRARDFDDEQLEVSSHIPAGAAVGTVRGASRASPSTGRWRLEDRTKPAKALRFRSMLASVPRSRDP